MTPEESLFCFDKFLVVEISDQMLVFFDSIFIKDENLRKISNKDGTPAIFKFFFQLVKKTSFSE